MSDWASESGHWYDAKTGEPRYTTFDRNGNERATTLRDAKKHGWVPSVTTIIGCAARFGLEKWKAEQLLLAGLTLTRLNGETEADWIKRVWEDSAAQAGKARGRGTEIHAEVEAHYADRECIKPELQPWVNSIAGLVAQTFGKQVWRPEKSFAHPLGYGGKVDLHSDSVLIDFKGKEARNGVRDWRTYDEHAMQLAAYARGLAFHEYGKDGYTDWPRSGIIFFDRDEPYCEWHEVKAVELERGWRKFEALLAYWKADKL